MTWGCLIPVKGKKQSKKTARIPKYLFDMEAWDVEDLEPVEGDDE